MKLHEHARKIKRWKIETVQDVSDLLNYASKLWDCDYGFVKIRKVNKEDKTRYTFITGGWSENEYIASALEENQVLCLFSWQKSERGGLQVFEILKH